MPVRTQHMRLTAALLVGLVWSSAPVRNAAAEDWELFDLQYAGEGDYDLIDRRISAQVIETSPLGAKLETPSGILNLSWAHFQIESADKAGRSNGFYRITDQRKIEYGQGLLDLFIVARRQANETTNHTVVWRRREFSTFRPGTFQVTLQGSETHDDPAARTPPRFTNDNVVVFEGSKLLAFMEIGNGQPEPVRIRWGHPDWHCRLYAGRDFRVVDRVQLMKDEEPALPRPPTEEVPVVTWYQRQYFPFEDDLRRVYRKDDIPTLQARLREKAGMEAWRERERIPLRADLIRAGDDPTPHLAVFRELFRQSHNVTNGVRGQLVRQLKWAPSAAIEFIPTLVDLATTQNRDSQEAVATLISIGEPAALPLAGAMTRSEDAFWKAAGILASLRGKARVAIPSLKAMRAGGRHPRPHGAGRLDSLVRTIEQDAARPAPVHEAK